MSKIPVILRLRLHPDDLDALRTAAGMSGKTLDAYVSATMEQMAAMERGTLGKNGAA